MLFYYLNLRIMKKRVVTITYSYESKKVVIPDIKKRLPFVYDDGNKRVTVSKKLIPGRSVNEIRGLMISKELEMEINPQSMSWLEAKKKAISTCAELLSVKDLKLYVKVYPSFVETIRFLIDHGYKHTYGYGEEADRSIFGKYGYDSLYEFGYDGTWCEELFRSNVKVEPYYIYHAIINVSPWEGSVHGTIVNGDDRVERACRLIHRHYDYLKKKSVTS